MERVDARRGTFEVRDRGGLVVVSVVFNAPRSVTDRFNRLREGDFVRIEGRFSNQHRFDLENFQQSPLNLPLPARVERLAWGPTSMKNLFEEIVALIVD